MLVLRNWEWTEPEIRYMPKRMELLGYVPFEYPEDPIGKLKYFKLVKGLSYERLGELMGKDPEQGDGLVEGENEALYKQYAEDCKVLGRAVEKK